MCRIAGIFHPSSQSLRHDVVVMRDAMHRGGPDDSGLYVHDQLPLAFGHRRLALLDLSPAGHQPMHRNHLLVVFNGEIYNFKELKETLTSFGHQFATGTDTEVILAAYQQWGKACFEKFNGMFALAIWDEQAQELVLARDHAGIKPLYYHLSKDKLIFASEIRSFKALNPQWPENEEWKVPFLAFGHLPEPFTTLKDVQPLAKGTCMVFQLPSLSCSTHTFSRLTFSKTINDLPTAIAAVKEKLEKAVHRHLISDAPIGLFLSGGIDSSLLTLLAQQVIPQNLQTLSIVFEDATLNEEKYQQLIIDKTNAHHQSFLVTEQEFGEELPEILQAMDQPSTDGINSYFICKYAKRAGLTAALSGLGADELFGGYASFSQQSLVAKAKLVAGIIPGFAGDLLADKYQKIDFLKRKDIIGDYLFYRGFFSTRQIAAILQVTVQEVNRILSKVTLPGDLPAGTAYGNKVSWVETNLYMQNQLLKDTDAMSMWHGLEVRVPFLDKELMETVYAIDASIKFDPKQAKHLLVKAFSEILPVEIWQRKKQGFTFPFYKWMRNIGGVVRTPTSRKMRDSYNTGRLNWSRYWAYILCHDLGTINYSINQPRRVMFLNLDAFSEMGGIEKFNRSFLKALGELEEEGTVVADALSLHDTVSDDEYFNNHHYRGIGGNRIAFVLHAIKAAANYDTIVLGHINLALPGYFIKKRYPRKKVMVITHGIEVWHQQKGVKAFILHNADKVLAVSNFTKTKLIEHNKVAEDKVVVFHNTIDPFFSYPTNFQKPVYLKERYGLNGAPVIYTLTRMAGKEKYKGYDSVIRIMPEVKKKYPGIKYIIGGKADKEELERITKLVTELQLEDTVILAGFIKDEEITDHYLLADTFIMPSVKEGFGIVFIEAMACGLPAIAGNVDGSVDALINGAIGKLVDPACNKSILEALLVHAGEKDRVNHALLQQKVEANFGFKVYKHRVKKLVTG